MAALSVVMLVLSLLLLADRLFFAGIIGLFVPMYIAVITSLLGLLIAFLRSAQVTRRPRSKNKLKKVRQAHALMVLNVLAGIACAALWLFDLAKLL